MLGMAIAALSVVSSGMQQKHSLTSHELLANTAPAQVCRALSLDRPSINQQEKGLVALDCSHHCSQSLALLPKSSNRHLCRACLLIMRLQLVPALKQALMLLLLEHLLSLHTSNSRVKCMQRTGCCVVSRLAHLRHILTSVLAYEQAWTLLLLGPFLNRYISHAWIFSYDWKALALTFLTLSCVCAVGVNVSQSMCLGRFSAVSYQVGRRRGACTSSCCAAPLKQSHRACTLRRLHCPLHKPGHERS